MEKRRFKHLVVFLELPVIVFGKLEWRLESLKNKDGKGHK